MTERARSRRLRFAPFWIAVTLAFAGSVTCLSYAGMVMFTPPPADTTPNLDMRSICRPMTGFTRQMPGATSGDRR